MEKHYNLSELFQEPQLLSGETAVSPDDIFSILEALETPPSYSSNPMASTNNLRVETEPSQSKRRKIAVEDAQPMSHISVERNRRKQMNEHLAVLRSLMPCFYVKRGDQASIIEGVINYINELQQVIQSLESKKQRKSYTDIIFGPRPGFSPRTPQPGSPYMPGRKILPVDLSPCNSSTSSINDSINELAASSKSTIAEVEVNFSGPNLQLKTISDRILGQAVRIISALEEIPLEILQVNINTVDDKMINSFTIKIGIECKVSAEEVAELIQQTFCYKACGFGEGVIR